MALGFNKNRDTLDVFNDRWKANHNTKQVDLYKERNIRIANKMFGGDFSIMNNIPNTKEDKVNDLNKKIQGNNEVNRNNKVNSIIDNFRK